MNQNLYYDLDGPWSIGSDDYLCLLNHVNKKNIRKILELGSGQSTFQLANDFPNAQVISLENDPDIAKSNRLVLDKIKHGNSQILYSPVMLQFKSGGGYMTYNMDLLKDIQGIDLLIVDGPVEKLYPMGREGSLFFLFDKLAVGAIVGLDDYHRDSAKTAVANWKMVFKDSIRVRQETESFAVLEKVAECDKARLNLSLAFYSYINLLKSLYRIYRRKLGLRLRSKNKISS